MRTRVLSLLLRPMSPPLASWIVVAVALIVAETLVVYPLRRVAPEISLGVVLSGGCPGGFERRGAGAGPGDRGAQRRRFGFGERR
jgi:uncharacterized RDD family membrane protein YckC